LISFITIAVTIAILGLAIGNASLSTIAMLNVLAGALVGFPLLLVGNAKLTKTRRILFHADVNRRPALYETPKKEITTQTSKLGGLPAPGSITEDTTVQLQKPNPGPNR